MRGVTPQQQSAWDGWVASRPPVVQDLCTRLPPWGRYINKVTGQIGCVLSYSEDGTVRMLFDATDMMPPLEVFGVKPDDLEPLGDSFWVANPGNA